MTDLKYVPPEWWFEQSVEDHITAKSNLDTGRFYAAAFYAHQTAEKAVKFAIVHSGREMPYTHSMRQLVSACEMPDRVRDAAMELGPLYGKAKCPYHADGVPAYLFDSEQARGFIEKAGIVLEWARSIHDGEVVPE
ncbi:MAG: HEPN domain-containing protein [Candidatus Coatesbacteria bacterium]|nr:HEPN domain-containing protein [Candidatus Coatesbacteria bacterium]